VRQTVQVARHPREALQIRSSPAVDKTARDKLPARKRVGCRGTMVLTAAATTRNKVYKRHDRERNQQSEKARKRAPKPVAVATAFPVATPSTTTSSERAPSCWPTLRARLDLPEHPTALLLVSPSPPGLPAISHPVEPLDLPSSLWTREKQTPVARLTYQVSAAPAERTRVRRLLQTGVRQLASSRRLVARRADVVIDRRSRRCQPRRSLAVHFSPHFVRTCD
jgi:hypothetical protein